MGNISSTSVKNTIKNIVSEEDSHKPLSDQHIADMLKRSGITIARRTVAKYREELGIPSQIQRKKIDQLKGGHMNIIVTGRHIEVTPALKDYAEKKISKI